MSKNIEFYLEKTLSENPSDVAHLLKYMYFSYVRFDGKYWYHFTNHKWVISDKDESPLVPIIKNELVNKYLNLASDYNEQVIQKNRLLSEYPNEDPEQMTEYLPLIKSDLVNKSRLCTELSIKLTSHSYYQKVIDSAQELFTTKNFRLMMDQNLDIIGFNNGLYNIVTHSFDIANYGNKILMSTNYDFRSVTQYTREIVQFFKVLDLEVMLPSLAALLSGRYRQPLIWIRNLTEDSLFALTQLLQWSLGDYQGSLPFEYLRKRKIPSSHVHTHTELVENCKKRIVIVEQLPDDFPDVFSPMVDTLLSSGSLTLRKPRELDYDYIPQFGIVVLSRKKDDKPMDGALVFEAKEVPDIQSKEEWKHDFLKLLINYIKESQEAKKIKK